MLKIDCLRKNLILLLLLTALPCSLVAKPRDLGAFSNVRTGAARMPFYKNKVLEYYLRSRSMAMRGKLLDAHWPMVDSVREGISVEKIAGADNSSTVYALGAPLDAVLEFWENRSYSQGVILSESATFDQANRSASGTAKVFLRSPQLDLDGMGFSADFNTHFIRINSNVEIVLRSDSSRNLTAPLSGMDKKKSSGKAEKKWSTTRAYCNELTIDSKRNIITLIGNVRIFDPAGTITSDKLEIEFGDVSGGKKNNTADPLSGTGKTNLRKARFIGNVHAVRKLDPAELADGEQTADADMIVYNAVNDTLEMTGTGRKPQLARGSDIAVAGRIVMLPGKKIIRFFKDCYFKFQRDRKSALPPDEVTADYADWNYPENLIRLIGKADVKSPADKTELQADRIEITLADRQPVKAAAGRKNSSVGKRAERSVADGNVRFVRNNNGVAESAVAGRMVYVASNDQITLENKPVIRRGNDVIAGGEMVYDVSRGRMVIKRSSSITLSGATVDSQRDGTKSVNPENSGSVTVNSRSSDLDFGGNKLAFNGNVEVRGRGMKLDSDNLDIALEDDPARKKNSKDKVASGKRPVRALAVGNVHAEDESGILEAGVLDVRFGDKAAAGSVEVEKIFASGKVRLQSKQDKGAKQRSSTLLGKSGNGTTTLVAERGVLDLLKNTADFYEKVIISDTGAKLECDHLHVIARRAAGAVPALSTYKARDEFPDRLAVGKDRELVQIDANNNVRISRTLPSGEVQRATGDNGVYLVKNRKVMLTCKPPKRPQAVTADSGMVGDKVTIELDTEDIYVENGDALTRMKDMDF